LERGEATVENAASAITTRQELIVYTSNAWNTFVTYVDLLPDEQWTGPKDGAGWSVKDHVSHVTQWDRAVIAALRRQMPMQEYLGVSTSAWGAESFDPMNEEIRRLADGNNVDRVKADRDATWRDLVTLMDKLGQDQLAQPGREAGLAVGAEPLDEPVLAVLVDYWGNHYAEHLEDIKAIVEDQRLSSRP
jgi:hypothetical protein